VDNILDKYNIKYENFIQFRMLFSLFWPNVMVKLTVRKNFVSWVTQKSIHL